MNFPFLIGCKCPRDYEGPTRYRNCVHFLMLGGPKSWNCWSVLEARSLGSRQGRLLSAGCSRGGLAASSSFWGLLGLFCAPWLAAMWFTFLCVPLQSLRLSVSPSKLPSSHKYISHWIRARPDDLLLTWSHLQRPSFQIRSPSQVLGRPEFWGGTHQPSRVTFKRRSKSQPVCMILDKFDHTEDGA